LIKDMHVNFAKSRRFSFSLKTLRDLRHFKLTRGNLFLIAIGILAFMILFGVVQKIRLDLLQGQLTKIKSSTMALQGGGDLKGEMANLIVGREVALAKYNNRTLWNGVLKGLSNKISSGVYYESVENEGETSVKITGLASDQSAVTELVNLLDEADVFDNVKLISSSIMQKDDVDMVEFQIKCNIVK